MNKKSMMAIGACGLVAAATVLPMSPASAGTKGKLCNDGTFHVLHNDSIGGVKVPGGYYNTYTKGVSCYDASNYLHEWLAYGYTTDSFTASAPGTRGSKSVMFRQPSGNFFQIKKVQNPS